MRHSNFEESLSYFGAWAFVVIYIHADRTCVCMRCFTLYDSCFCGKNDSFWMEIFDYIDSLLTKAEEKRAKAECDASLLGPETSEDCRYPAI